MIQKVQVPQGEVVGINEEVLKKLYFTSISGMSLVDLQDGDSKRQTQRKM